MDSDGTVRSLNKGLSYESLQIEIFGHESYIKPLHVYLQPFKAFLSKRNCDNLWYVGIRNKECVKKYFDWVYQDVTIKLERKYERFLKYFEHRLDRVS